MSEAARSTERLVILANEDGEIVAGLISVIAEGEDPPMLEFMATAGQVVDEVEMPSELLSENGTNLELLQRYRLDLRKESRLIPKSIDSAS